MRGIYNRAGYLSKKAGVKNPISIIDSSYLYVRTIVGDSVDKNICNTLDSLFIQYESKEKEITIKEDELLVKRYELDEIRNLFYDTSEMSITMIMVGILLMLIGLVIWSKSENDEKILKIRQNLDKPTFSDNCQSCGKLFNSMTKYGLEKEGNKNYHFCSECYQNGDFTNPSMSLEEMKEQRQKEFLSKKYSKIRIFFIISHISQLDRWR